MLLFVYTREDFFAQKITIPCKITKKNLLKKFILKYATESYIKYF